MTGRYPARQPGDRGPDETLCISGSYITARGNLLADFSANANAEMQGRIQIARLYLMTDDHGVRDLLSFLLAATPCIRTSGVPRRPN